MLADDDATSAPPRRRCRCRERRHRAPAESARTACRHRGGSTPRCRQRTRVVVAAHGALGTRLAPCEATCGAATASRVVEHRTDRAIYSLVYTAPRAATRTRLGTSPGT